MSCSVSSVAGYSILHNVCEVVGYVLNLKCYLILKVEVAVVLDRQVNNLCLTGLPNCVGSIVLRDRKLLSEEGLMVVVATIDSKTGAVVAGPDVVSRGFVYVRESESLMDNVRQKAEAIINAELDRGPRIDRIQLKTRVKDDLARFIYQQTKRKPMILPIIKQIINLLIILENVLNFILMKYLITIK